MRRWSATVIGEVLEIDPDRIRVVRPDSLESDAEQHAGRQPHGDHARRRRLSRRAETEAETDRHRRARSRHPREDAVVYADGGVVDGDSGDRRLAWARSRRYRAPQLPSAAARIRAGAARPITSIKCRPAARCRRRTAACRCIRATRSNSISCCCDRSRSRPAENPALRHRPRLRHGDQSAHRPRHDLGGIAHGIGAALTRNSSTTTRAR